MRAGSSWTTVALVLAPALALGCAAGVEGPETSTFGPSPGSTPMPDTQGNDETTDGDPFPDPDPIDTTTGWGDDTTSGVPPDETTTGVPPDETTGDPPMGDCPNLTTCAGAMGIGSVSGDQSSSNLMASGSEPTWLKFQVTENDDSLVGAGMSFTATLTSPAGANFDLYVYRGVEGGATGCGGFAQQSIGGGAQDQVKMTWGEGLAANGIDDGVWVAVEVRAKDDMCAPPQEWSLTVAGNT